MAWMPAKAHARCSRHPSLLPWQSKYGVFNQPLSKWDVSSVEVMARMFQVRPRRSGLWCPCADKRAGFVIGTVCVWRDCVLVHGL